jgi:hypothetical protein
MGLETATFIAGLTPTWPIASEPKSQGDDHLRLIKSVLQATFPSATRALYFPKGETSTTPLVLDATDQNNFITIDTTAGNVAVTLPAALAAGDAGWSCEVVKTSADGNAVIVAAASGNISSQVGSTANIRVGALYSPTRFVWTGAAWICVKPGAMVGSTVNWDGPALPPGWLTLDGSVVASTTYVELGLALGVTVGANITLRDKRGRVEAGVDGGANRLTATFFGVAAVNGAVGGGESHVLTIAELAAHRHVVTINDPAHSHTYNAASASGAQRPLAGGSQPYDTTTLTNTGSSATGIRTLAPDGGGFDTTNVTGTNGGHTSVQHTIVTQKLIRAC